MEAKQKLKKLRGKVEAYFRSRSKQTETDHRREKKRRSVQKIKYPKEMGAKGIKGRILSNKYLRTCPLKVMYIQIENTH